MALSFRRHFRGLIVCTDTWRRSTHRDAQIKGPKYHSIGTRRGIAIGPALQVGRDFPPPTGGLERPATLAAGVDISTLAKWERGEREPTGAFLELAVRFLNKVEGAGESTLRIA